MPKQIISLRTHEGKAVVEETIKFLQAQKSLKPNKPNYSLIEECWLHAAENTKI